MLKINWNTGYSEEPQHIDDMPKLAILRFPEAIIKSDLSNGMVNLLKIVSSGLLRETMKTKYSSGTFKVL